MRSPGGFDETLIALQHLILPEKGLFDIQYFLIVCKYGYACDVRDLIMRLLLSFNPNIKFLFACVKLYEILLPSLFAL